MITTKYIIRGQFLTKIPPRGLSLMHNSRWTKLELNYTNEFTARRDYKEISENPLYRNLTLEKVTVEKIY